MGARLEAAIHSSHKRRTTRRRGVWHDRDKWQRTTLWTLTTYDEKAGRLDYVFIAPGCRPTTRSLGKCDQCSSDQGRSA